MVGCLPHRRRVRLFQLVQLLHLLPRELANLLRVLLVLGREVHVVCGCRAHALADGVECAFVLRLDAQQEGPVDVEFVDETREGSFVHL